jgi:hypothetical protein
MNEVNHGIEAKNVSALLYVDGQVIIHSTENDPQRSITEPLKLVNKIAML